jgi:hypothetical protein
MFLGSISFKYNDVIWLFVNQTKFIAKHKTQWIHIRENVLWYILNYEFILCLFIYLEDVIIQVWFCWYDAVVYWFWVYLVLSLFGVELISVWFIWFWFNWCLLNIISVVVWCHSDRCAIVCRVAMVAIMPPFVVLLCYIVPLFVVLILCS